MKQIHLKIHGRVQGVNFRSNTKRQAEMLDLTGWVKNMPDGTVEIVAEGDESKIQELISWAEQGPRFAKVKEIKKDSKKINIRDYNSFEIRY